MPAERRRRSSSGRRGGGRSTPAAAAVVPPPEPQAERGDEDEPADAAAPLDEDQLAILIAQTVAGLERSSGGAVLGVVGQACAPAQGSDVQRGRSRLPGVRRAAAPPGRAQRHRAERGLCQGRPRGRSSVARRRDGGLRAAARRRRRPAVPRPRPALWAEEPRPQGAAGLQREEVRLSRVPAVLPGSGHERKRRARMGRRGRGLPRLGSVGQACGRRLPGRGRVRSARSSARPHGLVGAGAGVTRRARWQRSSPTAPDTRRC